MSSFCVDDTTKYTDKELDDIYPGNPQGSQLLPSNDLDPSSRENNDNLGMIKESVIKNLIDNYKRSGGKLPNPEVLDAEQYLVQIREFIIRVKQEYCFYEVRYKFALDELLGAVIQNYLSKTGKGSGTGVADSQVFITKYLEYTRKLNRKVNDLIQIINGVINDLMLSSERFKKEIDAFNKQIQELKNKLLDFQVKIFLLQKNCRYFKCYYKNISIENRFLTLDDCNEYIESLEPIGKPIHKSIFIKMDIEGYELQWIESLSLDQLQNISQLVIEFHSAFTDRHKKMFQKLNEVFALVHLHGNNFKYDLVNNIPYFFECTYINKKYLTKSLEFNTDTIPSTLDQPNLVSKPDVFLNFEPYVHNNIRLPRTLKLGPKGFY